MWVDPRGPRRKVVEVVDYWKSIIRFDCGHVEQMNPAFQFKVGEVHNCFTCLKEKKEERT